MNIREFHPWNVSPKEAIEIQNKLRSRIVIAPFKKDVKKIAGVDASYSKRDQTMWAAVVVMDMQSLQTIEKGWYREVVRYPYIPGLLSFREIPTILNALKGLKDEPDLILCDGQGIAHPRRMGIAAHLGLILDMPTIGCAKNLLIGYSKAPPDKKGSFTYIRYKKEIVGASLRTREGVKPVYISPGYGIDLEDSISIIMRCITKYRLPEPIREAHRLSNYLRKKEEACYKSN